MKNLTLKIDDETYRKARIHAAREGTSISAMVRAFLVRQASADEAHAERVASLRELYRVAEARGNESSDPLEPLSREEIYRERLR